MPNCIYCKKPIELASVIWWRLPNGVSKDIHLECWNRLDENERMDILENNEIYYQHVKNPLGTPEEIDKSREWYEDRL